MKKIPTAAIIFLLIPLLFSCAGYPSADNTLSALLSPYECEIAVNDGDGIYTAHVSRDGEGELHFDFCEPALLSGTEYVCDKDGLSVVYNDLRIPVGGFSGGKITRGVTVWQKMLTPDGEYGVRTSNDGGKKQYVITNDETEYRFDAETNSPVLIKNGDITITITDFRLKNDKTLQGAGENIESGA